MDRIFYLTFLYRIQLPLAASPLARCPSPAARCLLPSPFLETWPAWTPSRAFPSLPSLPSPPFPSLRGLQGNLNSLNCTPQRCTCDPGTPSLLLGYRIHASPVGSCGTQNTVYRIHAGRIPKAVLIPQWRLVQPYRVPRCVPRAVWLRLTLRREGTTRSRWHGAAAPSLAPWLPVSLSHRIPPCLPTDDVELQWLQSLHRCTAAPCTTPSARASALQQPRLHDTAGSMSSNSTREAEDPFGSVLLVQSQRRSAGRAAHKQAAKHTQPVPATGLHPLWRDPGPRRGGGGHVLLMRDRHHWRTGRDTHHAVEADCRLT